MKDKKYDIWLIILGSIIAFLLSVSASAFYDLFKTIALEVDPTQIKLFQFIFIIGPLAMAFYLLKNILEDFNKDS